ncbi:HME family heavy-metal exporter [Azospirillum fermentarium]|uniref:efflux RND transporter permease subunit n=1 Tax=Azospirillum fermentarium TaxID=1233114 RepID=UPI002226A958|nr:efflux RND transporter permease subunit [Azospirillum fermentarium]MCW2249382.1 HME family heavy-metal exporter [Azospirillum fermentarium]
MFQFLVGISLRQKPLVLLATVMVTLWGMVIARGMPIDLLPDLHPPVVTIVTEAGGFAPEEVEQLITYPMELMLNGMPGVTRVRSSSSPGFSLIYVEFEWGTDPYRNRQLVTERIAMARDRLPQAVSPHLAPMSSVMGLAMQVVVSADAMDPMSLREVADWTIRPRLMAVEGVSQVYVVGGDVRQFRFTPNPVAMNMLDISLSQVEQALTAFGGNSSGGFNDLYNTEFIIRNVARSRSLDDMRNLVVTYRDNRPVLLSQIGDVGFAAKVKRGEGSFNGQPSVLLAVLKHPSANSVRLAAEVKDMLADIAPSLPQGVRADRISYSQSDLITASIDNVEHVLRDAIVIVAIVLAAFLWSARTTAISLLAIPISLIVTVIILHLMGSTINTMTLGGIAIGIGQLVDDSVVYVENTLRRLGGNRRRHRPLEVIEVILRASQEVRSGIIYATAIILLVFLPLFALPGEQGRLFGPLGVAYIVSIFASLLVSVTVTPALCAYLLPNMRHLEESHDGRLIRGLKRLNARLLGWALDNPRTLLGIAGAMVIASALVLPLLPRSFLPAFNEGTLYVQLLNRPGISLAESSRVGAMAEQIILQVPEVVSVARRTGRNEEDEDADPVNSSEFPIRVRLDGRARAAVIDDLRTRLSVLPVELTVTQFLTSRMEVAQNGVRGAIVLKIFGEDLGTLRMLAAGFRQKFDAIPGLKDLLVEQQVQVPQIRITIDYERAKLFGVTPAQIAQALENLSNGRTVSQVIDGGKRFDVVMKLSDADRTPETLAQMRMETPAGYVPLSSVAAIVSSAGPNQIMRESGMRRIVVTANTDGSDMAAIVARMRAAIAATPLPTGYTSALEGSFRQEESSRTIMAGLCAVSMTLVFLVLYQRYRSTVLSLVIMANIPLALIGCVVALVLFRQDLSLAAMIGFIAVTGVAVRNGVLKISHFINLALHEGVPAGRGLILRGCEERLTPVLMTALSAGLALIPLLFTSDMPGTEILHPVAVAIFGGLISSTLLDTLTTPVLFQCFGLPALERLRVMAEGELAAETF